MVLLFLNLAVKKCSCNDKVFETVMLEKGEEIASGFQGKINTCIIFCL